MFLLKAAAVAGGAAATVATAKALTGGGGGGGGDKDSSPDITGSKDQWKGDNSRIQHKNEKYTGTEANHDHKFSTTTRDLRTGKVSHHEGARMTKDGKHTT